MVLWRSRCPRGNMARVYLDGVRQSPRLRCSCTEASLRDAAGRRERAGDGTIASADGADSRPRMVPMIGHGRPALRVLALRQEIAQDTLHPLEIARASLRSADSRSPATRRIDTAISPVLELQELSDLFQREAQLLRALDEADPLDQAQRVVPESAIARRHRQQLPVLVVANGLDANVRGAGEPADRERIRSGRMTSQRECP